MSKQQINNSIEVVCRPVRRDYPLALANGLSTVQADNPCYISLVAILAPYARSAKDLSM